MLKILLVDDHQMFGEGLKSLLESEEDIEILGQAQSGQEALFLLSENQADVILMDIEMPRLDGIQTTKHIVKKYPDIKILALSMHNEKEFIKGILKAGAHGYMLKNAGKTELLEAIRKVHAGETFYSPEISQTILEEIMNPGRSKSSGLSTREREVLQLIADQYTTHEIAEKLFLSVNTIETHRRNMLVKLGLRNTAGLIKYATLQGLVE